MNWKTFVVWFYIVAFTILGGMNLQLSYHADHQQEQVDIHSK